MGQKVVVTALQNAIKPSNYSTKMSYQVDERIIVDTIKSRKFSEEEID